MIHKIGMVEHKFFDHKFYKRAYDDITYFNGTSYQHFETIGYRQNRLPSKKLFDVNYPLFKLSIFKKFSKDLKFKRDEQYYSYFHHFGFNENRIFGSYNHRYINKGLLYITKFNRM